ncbi:MAG: SDR family NAD(P)-dependent oxidoreductase, partial [Methanomassiliicoccales archaeon]
ILITGGATGIGLSLADAFLKNENEVIICARTEENLRKAKNRLPELNTIICDVSKEAERVKLHDWVISNFPETNVLINNAGIQKMVDLRKGTSDLLGYLRKDGGDEIDINFKAYVYMAGHFIPDLMKRKEAAIMNVSSGLGFVPIASMPVYCATKAAVHSFTISLRHQLKDGPIKVFEIIPPTVNTDLDKGARDKRGQTDRGIPPEEVAKATLIGMEKNEYEISVGMAQGLKMGARENFDQIFSRMNR